MDFFVVGIDVAPLAGDAFQNLEAGVPTHRQVGVVLSKAGAAEWMVSLRRPWVPSHAMQEETDPEKERKRLEKLERARSQAGWRSSHHGLTLC